MKTHRIEQPDWSETRATIVVCVAAVGLSLQSFLGRDLDFLTLDPLTWPARPWQLLTACLLHGSALHLLFNVYWTWQLGRVIEPILGLWSTAALYLFLAAGPMAAEWALLDGGIGLSGLVYGAFGLLWALDRWAPGFQGVMDRRTTELFAIWFLVCIVLTATDVLPVANLAHAVGAVLGALVGAALPVSRRHRTAARAALVVATLVLALGATVLRPAVNRGHASQELVYGELFDRAYELLEAGDPEAAIEPLERAVELRPRGSRGLEQPGHRLRARRPRRRCARGLPAAGRAGPALRAQPLVPGLEPVARGARGADGRGPGQGGRAVRVLARGRPGGARGLGAARRRPRGGRPPRPGPRRTRAGARAARGAPARR